MKNNKSHMKLLVIGLIAMISLLFLTGCNKDILSMNPEDNETVTEQPVVEEVEVNLEDYELIDDALDANTDAYEEVKKSINDKIVARVGNETLDLSDEIAEIEALSEDLTNIEADIEALEGNAADMKLDAVDYLSQYYDVLVEDLEEFEKGNFKKIDTSLYKTYKVTKDLSVAEQNN